MYNELFGLEKNPFTLTPDPAFLFLSEQFREALSGITRAIFQGSGITVLTGDVGTGKTALLSRLLGFLPGSKLQFSVVRAPSPFEIVELMLLDFGLKPIPSDSAQRLQSLRNLILEAQNKGRVSVLIVEEAEKLGAEAVAEISSLESYFRCDGHGSFHILLVGQPDLKESLQHGPLSQLNNRVSLRCSLGPLPYAEVGQYIRRRWLRAAATEPPFSPQSVNVIARASRGIPRAINIVCNDALLVAVAEQSSEVQDDLVREVAANLDLGRLAVREEISRPEATDSVSSSGGSLAGIAVKSPLDNYYQWSEPGTYTTVCMNVEAMERLQMEVLREGSEVGGVLLGRTVSDEDHTQIFVDDFQLLAGEHRKGSSSGFAAGDNEIDAAFAKCGADQTLSVVGYCRSHNRDGLYLSQDDLRIIRSRFRWPDNLFLIIKSRPNRICTAGFFFWKYGGIQSEFTDSEVPLIPLSAAADQQEPANSVPVPVEKRGFRHNLRDAMLIAAVVASTLTLTSFLQSVLAKSRHRKKSSEVQLKVATNKPLPPITMKVPSFVEPAAPSPDLPSPAITAIPEKLKAPISKGTQKAATRDSPFAVASNTGPAPERPAVKVERPPPAIQPPVPLTVPVLSESPVTPVVDLPHADLGPPAPPPPPPPARAFTGPQIIHQVTPSIPRGVGPMITTDVQVDVAMAIDARGKVTNARVASTRGTAAGLLTIEALKAAQLFRFQPAQENGQNVASSMVLTFRFARTSR